MSKTKYVKMDTVKKAADEVLEQYKCFKEQGDINFLLENLDLPVDKVIDIIVNSTIKTFIDMVYILKRTEFDEKSNKEDSVKDNLVKDNLAKDNLALKKKISKLEEKNKQLEEAMDIIKKNLNAYDDYLVECLGNIYNQYKLTNEKCDAE